MSLQQYPTDNLRISGIIEVTPPAGIAQELPISETAARTVYDTRRQIKEILHGRDDRLLAVVGPCSIHDPKAALEYAGRLKLQRERLSDRLLIVMRVYFEKPRTTVGWKGLINDPDLNDSYHINKGLRVARKLLLDLNETGMPCGVEFLDLITPQYLAELVSWGAIGARTTESQGHRELSSGLSCPVGFKNGTRGTIKIAVDAVSAASRPHSFLSVTKAGHTAIFKTAGNEDSHIILRGGTQGPNYDARSVAEACTMLEQAGLRGQVMVDMSHANSSKQYTRQLEVGRDVAGQIAGGSRRIFGVMIESHLVEGRQDVIPEKPLTYGQSITDACIGWDDTVPLLETLATAVATRRNR
jgi:3-deoxy-7-phosphoheptulonate synthase